MKKHVHTFDHSVQSPPNIAMMKSCRMNVGLLQNGRTHSLLFATLMLWIKVIRVPFLCDAYEGAGKHSCTTCNFVEQTKVFT